MEPEFQMAMSMWLQSTMAEHYGPGAPSHRPNNRYLHDDFVATMTEAVGEECAARIQQVKDEGVSWDSTWPLLDDADVARIMQAGAASFIRGDNHAV
jgi:hypothetical protein